MKLTDIFIKRPVLACVVSLLVLVLGLSAIFKLDVRQFPKMENTTITITTTYPGASAKDVQGFVTTLIAQSVGTADGIDYMSANSSGGVSQVKVYLKLNYDGNKALTDITGKVSAVLSRLPKNSNSPTISKSTGQTMPDLILGLSATSMSSEQVTAYINNVIRPKLNSLGGISQILPWGGKDYAMRIWLNTSKMANLGITPQEIKLALTNNNIQATAGRLENTYKYININVKTGLESAKQFSNLVIKNLNGRIIRLNDVARVELGSNDYAHQVYFNGKPAIFAAIFAAPDANSLSVIDHVVKTLPTIKQDLPPGLKLQVVYNKTTYIKEAIYGVIRAVIEAALIIILVIFLFLGTARSMLIPMVTVPLSLIGMCFFMHLLGYSINLLTLLAMVLAIGLVVDDAIVVMENIYRHLEAGKTPFQAAIVGAREIARPVIVMTTTLVAVFSPIMLMGGLTGSLFKEFAFVLAGAVVVSGIIALTLSPMLCSKFITSDTLLRPFVQRVDRTFDRFKIIYQRSLTKLLQFRPAILLVAITVLCSCYFLFTESKSELAPMEDQGFLFMMANGSSTANLAYLKQYNPQIRKAFQGNKAVINTFAVDGFPDPTGIMGGASLTPWGTRPSAKKLAGIFTKTLSQVPGLQTIVMPPPSLPGEADSMIHLILTTTQDHVFLYHVSQELLQKLKKTGEFVYVNNPLRYDKPELNIHINRNKAASLGISMGAIAQALNTMTGGNFVNYFSKQGYSFQVIPQVAQKFRLNPQNLNQVQLQTATGDLVPLSSVASYADEVQPTSLDQFQQLNSAEIMLVPLPTISQSEALATINRIAKATLPRDVHTNFTGSVRQYLQEGNVLVYAFLLAMIIIFLVLAAQFESFRDPLIVLVSVPMSICGALIPIFIGSSMAGVAGLTINIYTQIGLIALIGLISKHGILIVQYANQLQEQKQLSIRDAVIEAASIRLRPVLMTTLAMIFGVLPLIFASGAGAVSHFDIGIVIFCGMLIGTCFTLFVVPTIYTFLAHDRVAHLKKIATIQVMPDERTLQGE